MPKNKNQKTKTILRKDLLEVMAKCRKCYKAESGSMEEYYAYKEWVELFSKTFGDPKKSFRFMHLKDLTRALIHYDNKTVIKVFQALGYEIK